MASLTAQRIRHHSTVNTVRAVLRPRTDRTDLRKLGVGNGGWFVPTGLVRPGSIAYCVGVGEDITFDLELLRCGCEVYAFDPTPRAIAHVANHAPEGYHFRPVGLFSTSTTLKFYGPEDPKKVSHSAVGLRGTDWGYFEAPVETLVDLMAHNGHDHIDILKMDIEGAEHDVLPTMWRDGIRPTVLCVEFDQPVPVRKVISGVRDIADNGYTLVKQDSWNFTFVRD